MGEGKMPSKEIQERILEFFKGHVESGEYQACGLIKGFRIEIMEYIDERGGHFLQHVRHPIRHLHGTYKRPKGAENGLGRKPENEEEYFLGQVRWHSSRYRKYLRRSDTIPLVRLEDLSASILGNGLYMRQVMTYITQVDWTAEDITRVRDSVPPRNQARFSRIHWFHPASSITDKDPSAFEIWRDWTSYQQVTFLHHYRTIMLSLGYAVPEKP
jgi:hypothetical protein